MKKEIELKPCKCGKDKVFAECEAVGKLYGYFIGCYNLDCSIEGVIKIGRTLESAKRKAIKKWNKMVSV